jgi:hypothetical protein
MTSQSDISIIGVGETHPAQLPLLGRSSAGLHVTASGISAVVADRWTPDELTSNSRIGVYLHRYMNLTVLSLRFTSNLQVEMATAEFVTEPSGWVPPQFPTAHSRLLMKLIYVDKNTARIQRIRALTLDPQTSRHLVAALQHGQSRPITQAAFVKQLDEFYLLHPTPRSVRQMATHRGYAGA